MAANSEKLINGKSTRKVIKQVFQGRTFLSLEFFKRNFVYVVACVVMMLMYISNKYVCQNAIREVMVLKEELDNAKTDNVNASANYNSMIRESQMKLLVDTLHLDLIAPDQPPFILNHNQP